jgi:hypothetical protein
LKRLLIVAAVACILPIILAAENLKLRLDGDYLRVNASQIHFLIGRPLEKLHNGAVVTYLLQLTIRADRAGKILLRIPERFAVSYDLWEEKFSVRRLTVPERSASNLSVSAAESWCIENVSVPLAQLPADRPFWIALEYESESAKDANNSALGNLSLGSLVDIFSRRPRDESEVRGVEEIGPIRLEDLRNRRGGTDLQK